MRKFNRLITFMSGLMLVTMLLTLVPLPVSAATEPPSVSTNNPTNVTTSSATLNGKLTKLGAASSVNVTFEWGTTPGSYSDETTPEEMTTAGGKEGEFSSDLSGLDPGTTYYFRAKADGGVHGTNYGNEKSFTTGTTLPSVSTNNPTNVTTSSATLNGKLTKLGAASSVNVTFEWGTTPGSYSDETTPEEMTTAGGKEGEFSSDLSGLDPGTTYYFRAKADRGVHGTNYGNEKSFTTGTTLPSVSTNNPTNVTTSSATLNGKLTKLGAASSVNVTFEWGTTPGSYSDETTPEEMTTAGGKEGEFSSDLSGLDPGTTYYFRAKADGGVHGTNYGNEKSFTTGTTPLSVTTDDASDITTTGATLNASLDSLGTASSVDVSFEWGTSSGSYPNETTAEAMSATGAFSFDLSGLNPNTTYYFRAKADGGVHGTNYGNEKSFTTGTTPLSVTTDDASDITTTGATLNASLDSLGTASSVDVSFEWGTSSGSYPNETTAEAMSATGAFSFDLSGLNPNTTYYFRAKADGGVHGTNYGNEKSFTTGTTPLSVTTDDASDITTTGATLNASLDSLGTASSVDVSFEWGTSSGSYPNETTAEAMSATGAFSFDLSGLNPNTTYYFRAKADGGVHGTNYGNEKSFTTGTTPLSVTTDDASDITTTGATLNASLDSLGTASSVDVSFEWGTSSGSYPNETTAEAMSATGAFSFDLSGLNPNTTYYFRAKADGGVHGTNYGNEKSFTTGTTPPSVTTDDASDITTTGATLNASLDSLGTASSVDVSFEWGTSSGSLGNETTAEAMSATGAFSFDLSGLDPNTTYYFRVKAVGDGTSYGNEKSFTTGTTPLSVSTNNPTNVTTSSATLNGKLTKLGAASSVDVSFEWGTSSGSLGNETTAEAMSATGAFSFDLSGLDPNTTYYFRVKAVGDGTSYGNEKSFTTGTTPLSVSTNNPTNVTTSSATLNGKLTKLGAASSVDVSFEWGTSSGSLGNETTAEAMSATGAFSFDLSGLDPNTTYYFRVKAVGDGTSYGNEKSFTTGTTPLSVSTNNPTNVTTSSATLNGKLTKLGAASSVDVSFEWGTSSGSYPNETTAEAMSATGAFSFDLSGLNPNTTYYFRAKADGGVHGVSYSGEKSFITGTAPSTVTLTAEPIQIPADGISTSTITADVRYEDGNPVADGTIVRFTTDKGSFIGGAFTIDRETVGGIATAELKSILSAETVIATITAEVNGNKGATSVFFIEDGGTEIIDRKTEITSPGDYTIDAESVADTEVTKSGDGTPIVTVAKYVSNPGGTIPGGFAATGEYIDVHLDSSEDVDQIEIKNYYTAAQVAEIDESSLRMRWWDGESWVQCSDSGVNTENVNGYSGYVWAIITAGTTPNLTDLSGAIFGSMGTPPPEDDGDEGGGGGGGVTPGYWVVIIDNLGKITEARVSPSGELLESVRATDAEGQIALELDRGTEILCPGGKVPQRLEIRTIQISPPQDTVVLDGVYRLDAYLYEYSQNPSLFTISPPGKLALSYDLSDLPPNSLSVFSAYYDAQKGWVELSPGDISKADKLTVEVSGSQIFTIMVKLGPPPLPGEPSFRPSNLVIEPGEAKPGQEISISLIVTNIGGAAGTCTLELKVDGEVRSVKSVTLEPGESEVVSFSIIEDMEGEHVVEIADLEGDFTIVIISRPWWLLSMMGVIPMAVFGESRRRWQQRVEWSTGLKTKDWLVK